MFSAGIQTWNALWCLRLVYNPECMILMRKKKIYFQRKFRKPHRRSVRPGRGACARASGHDGAAVPADADGQGRRAGRARPLRLECPFDRSAAERPRAAPWRPAQLDATLRATTPLPA